MFVTKEKINESISPITANTLSFLVDSLRGCSEEDRKAAEALLAILTKDSNNASANADDDDERYVSQPEMLSYSHYVVIQSLEDISKALRLLSDLNISVEQRASDAVIYTGCRNSLEALVPVLTQIDEACDCIFEVLKKTKNRMKGKNND